MHLNPARRASDILTMVLCTPSLDKAHANCTHLCQLVDGLEALVDGESEELGKLLVVENLEAATGRDLADGGGMKTV